MSGIARRTPAIVALLSASAIIGVAPPSRGQASTPLRSGTVASRAISGASRVARSAAIPAVVAASPQPTTLDFPGAGRYGPLNYGDDVIAVQNAHPYTVTLAQTSFVRGHRPAITTRPLPADTTLYLEPDQSTFATALSSPDRIAAERLRGFTTSTTVSLGTRGAGRTFYFAEGYTGLSFRETLLLVNPGGADAHVVVTGASAPPVGQCG